MEKKTAFLDTTILTDILLKKNQEAGKIARESLKYFGETHLPVYAVKEFKAGPLDNYVWLFNKFTQTKSLADTFKVLTGVAKSPRKYRTTTAMEGLTEILTILKESELTDDSLIKKYGSKASRDETIAAQYADLLKYLILSGWKRRRKVTTKVVFELSCYTEKDPFIEEKTNLMKLLPQKCEPEKECCLAPFLRKNLPELTKLAEIVKECEEKKENTKRYRILREISRKPKQLVTEEMCKGLGDAYFAISCPPDAIVLTTNVRDHKPLAEAVGKKCMSPKEIVGKS